MIIYWPAYDDVAILTEKSPEYLLNFANFQGLDYILARCLICYTLFNKGYTWDNRDLF